MLENQNTLQNKFGISFLRILATFSVIIIHVSGPMVVRFGEISFFDWNVANLFDSISRYSVPMFFMISGSLILGKNYGLFEFLKNRFGKILFPFLFWSLVYSLFNRYVFQNETFSFVKIIKDVFYGSEYHLWFVYALFGIYLITPILRKWIANASQKEILYVLFIWGITLIISIPGMNIYFPKINLSYFTGFIGYFILGYYLKQYCFTKKTVPFLLIFFGATITIFGTYFMTLKKGSFYYYFYEYLSLNVLMVSSGLFLFFNKLSNSNAKTNSVIIKLNATCFGIYLVHPFVLKIFGLMGFDAYFTNPIFSILVVTTACFILCFVLIFYVQKLKYGYLIA